MAINTYYDKDCDLSIIQGMKVAVIGRQNTGKSTFINSLTETERMIVSEVPGTTRDSVDVRFELDGKAFLAIDTPGFNRGKNRFRLKDFFINSQHLAECLCVMSDCLECLEILASQRRQRGQETRNALLGDINALELWD